MQDKRKSNRKTLHYAAWIAIEGQGKRACQIADISDTGARLEVEDIDTIPDKFVLLLAANNAPKRACKVVWRETDVMGVQFEGRVGTPAMERPSARPHAQNAPSLVPEAAEPETEKDPHRLNVAGVFQEDPELQIQPAFWIAESIQCPPRLRNKRPQLNRFRLTTLDNTTGRPIHITIGEREAHRERGVFDSAFAPRFRQVALKQLHVGDLVLHAAARIRGKGLPRST